MHTAVSGNVIFFLTFTISTFFEFYVCVVRVENGARDTANFTVQLGRSILVASVGWRRLHEGILAISNGPSAHSPSLPFFCVCV